MRIIRVVAIMSNARQFLDIPGSAARDAMDANPTNAISGGCVSLVERSTLYRKQNKERTLIITFNWKVFLV